jgi:hypothetical protein
MSQLKDIMSLNFDKKLLYIWYTIPNDYKKSLSRIKDKKIKYSRLNFDKKLRHLDKISYYMRNMIM